MKKQRIRRKKRERSSLISSETQSKKQMTKMLMPRKEPRSLRKCSRLKRNRTRDGVSENQLSHRRMGALKEEQARQKNTRIKDSREEEESFKLHKIEAGSLAVSLELERSSHSSQTQRHLKSEKAGLMQDLIERHLGLAKLRKERKANMSQRSRDLMKNVKKEGAGRKERVLQLKSNQKQR